ncbi:MAG: lysylphosphatidylglycerol synthase transmembrane domain-containing protein [Gaiellaceae bacterium]
MKRTYRLLATALITGLCIAYILWKIDIRQTLHVLGDTRLGYFALAIAIMGGSVWLMAWRWQRLLAARGIHDRMSWLVRAYFTSYAAGQVLPTSLGGDAMRIFETSRRHPGRGGPAAGSVLLERVLGGAATLLLAALGFALAVNRYDIGAYLWIEGALIIAAVVLAVLLFARSARRLLATAVPVLRRLRLERPAREVYLGIHAYRENAGLLIGAFALTVGVQAVRILAIWSSAKAAGIDLGPRPFYVMGPLLLLVQLVPFTINGLAVRETFFISFLGQLGVAHDPAFAAGFLFFLVTALLSLPGGAILAWEGAHGTLARRGGERSRNAREKAARDE